MTARIGPLLLFVQALLAPSGAAFETTGLDPARSYRGMCFLSSSIGKELSLEEIRSFVASCRIDLVAVDFAWITHHWPRTDFAAVERLAAGLQGDGVEVVALYRPRALRPSDAGVHYAVDRNGKIAASHNELCLTHEDSITWGARWGAEILKLLPSIDQVALYNLRPACACEKCRDGGSAALTAAFLARCRAEWEKVRPGIRIGHVGLADEYAAELDFFMPFLALNRERAGGPPVDPAKLLAGARTVRSRRKGRAVVPFAKVCWESATTNQTEDVVATIAECRKQTSSFILWYYEWLFHHPQGRYDRKALVEALGGDWALLRAHFTESAAPAGSPNWIYFEGVVGGQGDPPKLVLSWGQKTEEVAAARSSVLISYLADRVFGRMPRLSVSLADTNRVLLGFDLPRSWRASPRLKAELVLDLKNSERLPVSVPFELAAHAVKGQWSPETTTWKNQPPFDKEPGATVRVEPRAQILRIDVTRLVRAWLAGDAENRGLLLKVAAVTRDEMPAVLSPEEPPDLTYPFLEKRIEKLPWPHQAPGLSPEQVLELCREVWVINDFPLYQADAEGAWRYFHGGLDIVLANGTVIHAVEDGYVKAIVGPCIVIADAEGAEPCYGWSYAHLGEHRVAVGEFVKRGTVIGVVEFKGLAHLHLDRVFSQGPYWGSWHYITVPNGHFTYTDDEPPVIETPFFFFRNDSDERIAPGDDGEVRLSGEVDLVVGMREAGRYARSEAGFGDRLGVMRMDYEIARLEDGPGHSFRSFDFGILAIKKGFHARSYGTELAKVVYKHYALFEHLPRAGDKALSYYVLTNCRGDEPPRELALGDRKSCWDTARKDAGGRRVFPDGSYRVTVTARDFDGHTARASMTVTVANGPEPGAAGRTDPGGAVR